MKKVLLILVIVFVVLTVVGVAVFLYADTRIKAYVETEAQARIVARVPQADGVTVTIDGFPLLFDVLFAGKIEALHVKVARVHSHGIEALDLSLDVEGIALDRDKMLSDRQLVVTGIDRAKVQGFLADDDVSQAAGAKVTFAPGKVSISAHGHTVDAKVRIVGRRIELSANVPGVPKTSVPLPEAELLPCKPDLEIEAGKLRLSCVIEELPDAVKRAMGSA